MKQRFNRRQAIGATIGALAMTSQGFSNNAVPISKLGLCQYCSRFAGEQAKRTTPPTNLFEPENYFKYARALGAGGYQVSLGVLEPSRAAALRDQAQSAGMFIEGMVSAPKGPSDLERFEAEMKSAAAVGAKAASFFGTRRADR
jgi:hypothetical protein